MKYLNRNKMAASDVTFAQDGGPTSVKLHPYLVALVRWCVSCLWSATTVLLHRLMLAPLPQITASKPAVKSRPASNDHLHPEPLVECVVLHQPKVHKMDVIFVHGLYGSLRNTWRQGDWRHKYKIEPNIVPVKRSKSAPNAIVNYDKMDGSFCSTYNISINENNIFDNYNKTDLDFRTINDMNSIFTEQMYRTELIDQVEIVDNFETQVEFVKDLFKYENQRCDMNCDDRNGYNNKKYEFRDDQYDKNYINISTDEKSDFDNDNYYNYDNNKCRYDNNAKDDVNECECKMNSKACEPGCGCVCDDCYSLCWPRDWIKEDYPDARVISINYTSDPYLWRPLWVKENKRLRLHERAEQMTAQLVALGVGQRPVVWVGHSKGGLFIKQIYCEAYEAYKRRNDKKTNILKSTIEDSSEQATLDKDDDKNDSGNNTDEDDDTKKNYILRENGSKLINRIDYCNKKENSIDDKKVSDTERNKTVNTESEINQRVGETLKSSISDEDRAALWSNSHGFMFYSVPHRGSPLADIRAPLTARSIELLEICKDSALVLSLQARWLAAAAPAPPAVRSLVETCRTLMSVLYLRIVSVDSADAGVGELRGVGVLDHREVCKPASRRCLLYAQLMDLVRAARKRASLTLVGTRPDTT